MLSSWPACEKPVAEVAQSLRISESCLRNWMARADADEHENQPG
nr:hypothetical protein [Saccharopolyspora sp. HNM0986]